MDARQEWIKSYKKEYRKTMIIFIVMIVIMTYICIEFFYGLEFFNLNLCYVYVLELLLFILAIKYMNGRVAKNADRIILKYRKDFDTEFAEYVYEQLLQKKNDIDRFNVMYRYLLLLLDTCQFEKFEEVYYKNRNIMKKRKMKIVLKDLIFKFSSLQRGKEEYRKQLAEYRFSKYHKTKGKLPYFKDAQRSRDESVEVFQLYEAGNYRKAIEKIEKMHIDNPWNQLQFQAEKEKCLYHLFEEYHMPNEDVTKFLFGKKWKALLETGEEYAYEHADRMLFDMKEDLKTSNKRNVLTLIIAFGAFLMIIFATFITSKSDQERYIDDLESWGFEVEELLGFCENSDMSAAVIYASNPNLNSEAGYYVACVNYYMDGNIPMKELKRLPLLISSAIWIEGEHSSYVVAMTTQMQQLTYDGKEIKDIKVEKFPKSSQEEIYLNCFLFYGEFDLKKLGAKEVTKDEFNDKPELNSESKEIREEKLLKYYGEEYSINSEVLIEDRIISSISNGNQYGFANFKANDTYDFITASFSSDTTAVTDTICINGDYYELFWAYAPEISTVEISYTVNDSDAKTKHYDAQEIHYWKLPYEDCSYQLNYLDKYGKIYSTSEFKDYLNQRIYLDGCMYWKVGVSPESVSEHEIDGKIESTVSRYNIPIKDKSSNFGVSKYKISDDLIQACIDDQWFIFEKLWEVEMNVSDANEDGVVLHCTHKGNGIASRFSTNDIYWIEKKTGNGWISMEYPYGDASENGDPHLLDKNSSMTFGIQWERDHGKLASGEYRIGKTVTWYDETGGNYVNQIYYANFSID